MSKIKLTGHASGSGVLTIAAPNTDSDRTITLPDVTGTLLDSGSTLDATKLTGALPAISGASLTGVLPLAGGTMTGDLTVSGASTPKVTIKSNDGTSASLKLQRVNENDTSTDFELKNNAGDLEFFGDNTSQNDYKLVRFGTTEHRYYTNNTERMRIDSSGNAGIGNTVAGTINGVNNSILTIGSGSGHSGMTVYTGDTNEGTISFADGTSGSATYKGMVRYDHNTNNLTLHTDSSERMNINANGNIGIGESTPIRKVVIAGSSGNSSTLLLHMDADTAGGETALQFKADSTNDDRRVKASIVFRRDDPGTRGTGNLHFCVNGDNNDVNVSTSHSRMHINSAGRIIINRSSAYSTEQVQINHSGASQYATYMNSTSGGTATHYHMSWARGDTQCGYMTSSPTTIGLNNASDLRLKENIQDSASATQSIKNIKVRQFDWKDNRDAHKDYGFVAQELVTVVPEAVAVGSDELKEDGTPVQIWGVDDSKLIPRLVKTIQELEARITTLEG